MTRKTQKPTTPPDVQTVAFVSLGCPKNLVDSEKMLGLLAEDGLIPVSDEADADAIVINTCGFLEASKLESLDVIREAAALKASGGRLKRVVVAGCLVQRHRAKMLEWCDGIDALIGVYDRDHVVEAVRGSRPNQNDLGVDLPVYSSIAGSAAVRKQRDKIEAAGYFESDAARLRLTPRHYAYLRMSEGCNQNCAFCTIPSIRGKMRSKPLDALLAEAGELMRDGAFELNLIGQDTTSYGEDIGYEPGLAGMLTALNAAAVDNGGAWLRLMYAYPSCFTDEMIDAIAALPHVLKYIDMPLQHINDRVLDSMRRKTSRKLIETLLTKLRDRVPGIAIRTTFITGYPGETDAEHDELVKFVRDFGFDNMGVFGYSPEPGTPSGTLHAQGHAIPDDVIEARNEELMLAQQEVVFARNDMLTEQAATFDVLIDEEAETEDGETVYVGRTYQQSPDIDGVTYVESLEPLTPGEVIPCTIIGSSDYDLVARPTAELHTKAKLPVV
ncbi:MAG: 30S ribosomal protein S12 methylthiotransferase RimO [Phycisphaera sp.]|nr:30S ribosomal protein S12 methylthiotransferase RimO [Phycisphaera sp.]